MLPQDPVMLLSVINMKLRDQYSSLSALCDDLDESESDIVGKMEKIGYIYDVENNQFIQK